MDTRYLQSFVMVVDSGSFADAARRLNLTPAAVGARVRALEETIGTALVRRAGRTVRATEAGLLVEPQFVLPKSCDWRVLIEEPLCVLAPATLAGRDPLELLASEPFIRYDRATWGGRLADRCLAERGIAPRERIEIDGLGAIAAFVSQGLGVSLIPDWTPPWPAGLDVIKLELPPPVPVRRMGLAWMTQGPRAALARAVLKEAEGVWRR